MSPPRCKGAWSESPGNGRRGACPPPRARGHRGVCCSPGGIRFLRRGEKSSAKLYEDTEISSSYFDLFHLPYLFIYLLI